MGNLTQRGPPGGAFDFPVKTSVSDRKQKIFRNSLLQLVSRVHGLFLLSIPRGVCPRVFAPGGGMGGFGIDRYIILCSTNMNFAYCQAFKQHNSWTDTFRKRWTSLYVRWTYKSWFLLEFNFLHNFGRWPHFWRQRTTSSPEIGQRMACILWLRLSYGSPSKNYGRQNACVTEFWSLCCSGLFSCTSSLILGFHQSCDQSFNEWSLESWIR